MSFWVTFINIFYRYKYKCTINIKHINNKHVLTVNKDFVFLYKNEKRHEITIEENGISLRIRNINTSDVHKFYIVISKDYKKSIEFEWNNDIFMIKGVDKIECLSENNILKVINYDDYAKKDEDLNESPKNTKKGSNIMRNIMIFVFCLLFIATIVGVSMFSSKK